MPGSWVRVPPLLFGTPPGTCADIPPGCRRSCFQKENRQHVRETLQLLEPVPPFLYPLVDVTREPNTLLSRRSGDDGFSGEIPANAVPNPTEMLHDGAPGVSP